MALFRRRHPPIVVSPTSQAIDGFWAWWARNADDVTTAVTAGHTYTVESMVGPEVARIHPHLTWELCPGSGSTFLFAISSDGHPELRTLAERWHRAAPPDDAVWQFRPARLPDPTAFRRGNVVEAGSAEIDLSTVVVQALADDQRCRLDVSIYHPRFFQMTEQARAHLSFLVLDWALGEDDVERWVGAVEAVTVAPIDPIPVADLPEVVRRAAQTWGGERWALMEGWHGERRLQVAIRHPLHRVDRPLFDEHVEIRLPYRDQLSDGLPGERALGDLRAFQETVIGRLGEAALLVGHETSAGERLLHLYDDCTASVTPVIQGMLRAYAGGGASVRDEPDAAWQAVNHLRPQ